MEFENVSDVVRWRLCMGCGACAAVCRNGAITLSDVTTDGIRPAVNAQKCQACKNCVKVCPGIALSRDYREGAPLRELVGEWGPVLEIWEGYAADPEIRFKASSGGAATALALFCLEQDDCSAVFHIGADPENPLQNVPCRSRSREDLVARTGSRYAPAAACCTFGAMRDLAGRCVFIGKPCDVAALRKYEAIEPGVREKLSVTVSIFCAATPATQGTIELLGQMGAVPSQVRQLRYRGWGWPGMTTVTTRNGHERTFETPYERSWETLGKYGQFRCRLCPDSTGEYADISCGDPWYRTVEPGDPGWSLVLVRTERGRRLLHRAIAADYVRLSPASPRVLPQSQPSLLFKRRRLWGRLFAMRLCGVPTPRYDGFSLFAGWRRLSLRQKLRSVLSTLRRVSTRRWRRPAPFNPSTCKRVISPLVAES